MFSYALRNNALRLCRVSNLLNRNLSTSIIDRNSESAKDSDGHYDLIIVGGGPAGLSMACAISKDTKLSDKTVLLLDGAPKSKGYSTDTYSNRVYSLNSGTVQLMESISAWNTITSIRHQSVKNMQVWDSTSDSMITFEGDSFADDMAYIVENDVLIHAVLEQIEKSPNITLQNDSRIENVTLATSEQELGSVTLKSGEKFSGNLIIGADGANSLVRRSMSVHNYSETYDQMGVIATVNLREPMENHTAWQRFLPNGVLALLPLSDCLCSIVWSTSTANAKQLLARPDDEFVDALNEALFKEYPTNLLISQAMRGVDSILGIVGSSTKDSKSRKIPPTIDSIYGKSRAAFPLGFAHSSSYVSHGTALIGDAAHRVHPLAGQGLNLGFGDVSSLAKHLAAGVYNGSAFGDLKSLRNYETERIRHNVPIMLGIHGIQKLYMSELGPIQFARSIGLHIVNSIDPLKKMFMARAAQ